jgi:hypothetical protein
MNLALKKKRLPLGNLLPQFPGIWFPYLKHGDNDYSYKIFKVPQQKPRTLVRARDGRPWRKMTGEGRIVGCLRQLEPHTSIIVLGGHQTAPAVTAANTRLTPHHTLPHLALLRLTGDSYL